MRVHPQPFAMKHLFERPLRRIGESGSEAERSKALDLGSSLFGGVGSNPTTARHKYLCKAYYDSLSQNAILRTHIVSLKCFGMSSKKQQHSLQTYTSSNSNDLSFTLTQNTVNYANENQC